MTARETITRLSKSQWPPSPTSVLKTVLGFVGICVVSVTSWLLLSHISGQVVQAETTSAVGALQLAAADVAADLAEHDKHDRKVDQTLHEVSLTTQRLADMLAHHDADIQDLKDDERDRRRRGRQDDDE